MRVFTVTLNPALDCHITNNKVVTLPGGKGINVSLALEDFGVDTTALAVIGGVTGRALKEELRRRGVDASFAEVDGNTRVNVKIQENGRTIEKFGKAPEVTFGALMKIGLLLRRAKRGDFVVFSGSLPQNTPRNIYKTLANSLSDGIRTALDTRGDILCENAWNNFIIKPNLEELSESAGRELKSKVEIAKACEPFFERGVKIALVSLGAEGALLVTPKGRIFQPAQKITPANTSGAGDALLAAFICAVTRGAGLRDALEFAVNAAADHCLKVFV
jgi:1-phosphofructokinase